MGVDETTVESEKVHVVPVVVASLGHQPKRLVILATLCISNYQQNCSKRVLLIHRRIRVNT